MKCPWLKVVRTYKDGLTETKEEGFEDCIGHSCPFFDGNCRRVAKELGFDLIGCFDDGLL